MRAAFDSVDDASNAVSDVIAAGLVPAAMELMDQGIVRAVEQAYGMGLPVDAAALLIVEIDGPAVGLDGQQERILEIFRRWRARDVVHARTEAEREMLWKCRKTSAGALGRLAPGKVVQDVVVPRTRLPELIRKIGEIGDRHGVRVVSVAHAGDGNVHPNLLVDERVEGSLQRSQAASTEILEECLRLGGSISAEHGIGIEKLDMMRRQFSAADLQAMAHVREAFDPEGRMNPGKLLPRKETR